MTALLAASLLALGAAAALVVWDRLHTRRLMARLDDMLTAALEGRFTDTHFDESRLSALESRLAQYLAAADTSARRLAQQKDQLATLVSDISHQTRTPVANLQLYAQLLAEQPLTPRGQECAAALTAQAGKLQTLIDALVKSSRLETGLLALHPVPGDLGALARRAAAQYQAQAAEKGVALAVQAAPCPARFDPKWTEEALCNLLDNAVKYTPAGGQVTLELRGYELFAALRVTDTGPGIPEEEQAKIFARFYRTPGAYQREGVGLGLYLARQIAAGQGGYLKVDSAPGRGSTFALCLPR